MAMDLRQDLRQAQQLMMLPQMQQAIAVLQMPIMELAALVDSELEQNPVVDCDAECSTDGEDDFDTAEAVVDDNVSDFDILCKLVDDDRSSFGEHEGVPGTRSRADSDYLLFMESMIQEKESLYEHLMAQAFQVFSDDNDRALASIVIGEFNEYGFLESSPEEIAEFNSVDIHDVKRVIDAVQEFDPSGVGAQDLRESLCIQLKQRGCQDSRAYTIVANHYDDMLHNRVPVIAKEMGCSVTTISESIKNHIAVLDIHPGLAFSKREVPTVVPDITIEEYNGGLRVVVNGDGIPELRINTHYLSMLRDGDIADDTRAYITSKINAGKWLVKTIHQRGDTLAKIGDVLIEKNGAFISETGGELQPMTMKSVADIIDVHESTVARAVAHKYVETPRGLFPLKFFFTNGYALNGGNDISSETVKTMVRALVTGEDKEKPLSDKAISELVKDRGIECARRTVAKYRYELGIGSTSQRRSYTPSV